MNLSKSLICGKFSLALILMDRDTAPCALKHSFAPPWFGHRFSTYIVPNTNKS